VIRNFPINICRWENSLNFVRENKVVYWKHFWRQMPNQIINFILHNLLHVFVTYKYSL
jgi:hypothetical protein